MNIEPSDALAYTGLNVFQAPFDDVHVRKAVNWALDKEAMWKLVGGKPAGEIAGHFIPPGMMGGLNADYDPFATEGNKGDSDEGPGRDGPVAKYDTDGDGVCDDPSCQVQALAVTNDNDAIKALEIMDASFQPIGISLEIKTLELQRPRRQVLDAGVPHGLLSGRVGEGLPEPVHVLLPAAGRAARTARTTPSWAPRLRTSRPPATPASRPTTPAWRVPNITADIVACRDIPIGPEQNTCWADLDKKVTEELATQIPRRFPNDIDVL